MLYASITRPFSSIPQPSWSYVQPNALPGVAVANTIVPWTPDVLWKLSSTLIALSDSLTTWIHNNAIQPESMYYWYKILTLIFSLSLLSLTDLGIGTVPRWTAQLSTSWAGLIPSVSAADLISGLSKKNLGFLETIRIKKRWTVCVWADTNLPSGQNAVSRIFFALQYSRSLKHGRQGCSSTSKNRYKREHRSGCV